MSKKFHWYDDEDDVEALESLVKKKSYDKRLRRKRREEKEFCPNEWGERD